MIHQHARKLLANCSGSKRCGNCRIHAATKGAQYPTIPNLLANLDNQLIND
jgi:hypothetical protein